MQHGRAVQLGLAVGAMGFAAVLAGIAESSNDWLIWVGLGLMGVATLGLVVGLILEKLASDKRRRVRNELAFYV